MSTAYGTLDQAVPSPHPHARQPLADRSGQQPGGWSSYVGVRRRPDGQGLDPDDAQHRPGHRPRHRRPRSQSLAPGSPESPILGARWERPPAVRCA